MEIQDSDYNPGEAGLNQETTTTYEGPCAACLGLEAPFGCTFAHTGGPRCKSLELP